MRNAPVTKQDVEAAIATLEAQGSRISTDRLIVQMGRGSATTVSRFLREIRAERALAASPALQNAAATGLPEDVVQKLTAMFTTHASEAYKVMRASLDAILQVERAANETELAQMGEQLDQALSEAVKANQALADAEEMLGKDALVIGELKGRVAALESDARVRDTQHAQAIEKLQQQLASTQQDLSQANADLAGQQQALAAAQRAHKDEASAHDKTREQLARAHSAAQAERTELLNRLQKQGSDHQTANAELQRRLEASLAAQGELRGRLDAQAKPDKPAAQPAKNKKSR